MPKFIIIFIELAIISTQFVEPLMISYIWRDKKYLTHSALSPDSTSHGLDVIQWSLKIEFRRFRGLTLRKNSKKIDFSKFN